MQLKEIKRGAICLVTGWTEPKDALLIRFDGGGVSPELRLSLLRESITAGNEKALERIADLATQGPLFAHVQQREGAEGITGNISLTARDGFRGEQVYFQAHPTTPGDYVSDKAFHFEERGQSR